MPAEFEKQSFVQLIFPHARSDWAPYLKEACRTFSAIASAIARYETCLIVCDDIERVRSYFHDDTNLAFIRYQSDDTWARDCSGITIYHHGKPEILDFSFNGWGGKFNAARDNAMTAALEANYDNAVYKADFILEGGAVDSSGEGAILTTSACLLNPNRNPGFSKEEIETKLFTYLGAKEIFWLNHGYLSGDDTDSHVDTLARFIAPDTIMYVQCSNPYDEHFNALKKMENELIALRRSNTKPFCLIPLPMCDAIYYEEERLPATYANFLMINNAVLVPTYNVAQDSEALSLFHRAFPHRDIIAIDCSVLIRQHGSLHCVTMQFPKGTTFHVN